MSFKKFIVFVMSVFSIVMAVAIASAGHDQSRYPLRNSFLTKNHIHLTTSQ